MEDRVLVSGKGSWLDESEHMHESWLLLPGGLLCSQFGDQ